MLKDRCEHRRPVVRTRIIPAPFLVESQMAFDAFEKENPYMPLPRSLDVQMRRSVVLGIEPSLQSRQHECVDFPKKI